MLKLTHIFIVNEQTFKVHLEHMFAGTGYEENEPDFLSVEKDNSFADRTEQVYISMIADISKTRIGDRVAFYVTGCKKIFGFFKIKSRPFFECYKNNYLGDALDKYLPLRVLIEPDEVYAFGITELEALDDISQIQHPYQMCWSLIYRKLTGMRGCSFVTDSEYCFIKDKIANKNSNYIINSDGYSYDKERQCIVPSDCKPDYFGEQNITLNINKRILNVRNSFEGHLQTYIIQNYENEPLRSLLLTDDFLNIWIGNEVVCSVGEQRIDILLIIEQNDKYIVRIIELKDEKPKAYIIKTQMKWYIKWVQQYIIPNLDKPVELIPTIVAGTYKRNCPGKTDFYNACNEYNADKPQLVNNINLSKLEFIKFARNDDGINFEKVI